MSSTRADVSRDEERGRRPLRAAPVPERPAGIGFLGMLAALAVAALGVLGIYEAVVLLGWTEGEPVLTPILTGSATVTPDVTTAVVGGIAALLGLWLLWTALKRGRRSGVRVGAGTGVWMTFGDLERIAAGAAEQCDGVLTASAKASARTVRVDAQTTGRDVEGDVRSSVAERLAALSAPPRVIVQARPRREARAR